MPSRLDLPNPGAFRRAFLTLIALTILAAIFALLTACAPLREAYFHPSGDGRPACGVVQVYRADGHVEQHGKPCR